MKNKRKPLDHDLWVFYGYMVIIETITNTFLEKTNERTKQQQQNIRNKQKTYNQNKKKEQQQNSNIKICTQKGNLPITTILIFDKYFRTF